MAHVLYSYFVTDFAVHITDIAVTRTGIAVTNTVIAQLLNMFAVENRHKTY